MIILSYALIFIGLIAIITAILGCYKLPDYFCRMHAATIGDAVGCPLLLLGIAIQSSSPLKIGFLSIILLFVSPASSYCLNLFAKTYFEKKDARK